MIKCSKIRYLFLVIITITLGLVSRKIDFIPIITGDVFYAVMAYWFSRFIFYDQSHLFSFIIGLTFCILIEFLQLVQTPFFVYIRHHPILRLVFGQGFLWSDLIAYLAGATFAFQLDRIMCSKAEAKIKP